jgi:hypothetical protein
VFASLQEGYFDWNEVRVTTISELAEVMSALSDPPEAANRLKRALQGVFEKYYSFDIDILRKGNLGKAVKEFEGINGITPFGVSYVAQNALSGHSIPVNKGGFKLFIALGAITEAEAAKGRIPGLERTIPKSKGVEFGSLLHQLAVDYGNSPFSTKARAIIVEIEPTAKERFPKRTTKKAEVKETKKSSAKSKKSGTAATAKKSKASRPVKKSTTKHLAKKKPR